MQDLASEVLDDEFNQIVNVVDIFRKKPKRN